MNFRTDIETYLIGRTEMLDENVDQWLRSMGVSEEFFFPEGINDTETLVGLAAKRCYKSFEPGLNKNVNRVRTDWAEYLENLLKQAHGSVLEHVSFVIAIEGLTRVATAELNRHRAGVAISEGSMRYIREGEFQFLLPPSLSQPASMVVTAEEILEITDNLGLAGRMEAIRDFGDVTKEEKSIAIIRLVLDTINAGYGALGEIWDIDNLPFAESKKLTSMFRRILPQGTCTGGVWTFNLRALRHIIAMRTDPSAEEEIALVIGKIGKLMIDECPTLMGDFTVDEATGAFVPKYRKV